MDIDVALAQTRAIFEQVIEEVDPEKLMQRYLRLTPNALIAGDEQVELSSQPRLVVIALGKAAPKMMAGALAAIGQRVDAALTITKAGVPVPDVVNRAGYPILFGGHPVPNDESVRAGELAFELVSSLGSDDMLLMLISGGGSALMELPSERLTLEDLQTTTNLLLRHGADISQQNAVRHRLSRLKGGKLAVAAAPARVINLIVSDVLGNPLPVIASGPTVAFDPKLDRGIGALVDAPLWSQLPDAVREALTSRTASSGTTLSNVMHSIVIADARTAAESAARAARALGYASDVLGVAFTGEAREFAVEWVERAHVMRDENDEQIPTCLVATGELTVTVKGEGLGGRNSEMVLSAAPLIEGDEHLAIASLATDGDDGATGAAGGAVTGNSCQVARAAGFDPAALLDDNDSQQFLDATGGALRTGLTGTNVNDLYLAFIDGPPGESNGRRETCAARGGVA